MTDRYDPSKRNFLQSIGVSGLVLTGGLVMPALAAEQKKQGAKKGKDPKNAKEPEVTPPEDLMREHGVLDRVLLVYEAGMRKFAANEDFDPAILTSSAEVVRDFIENYHEKSEETHVFPRFRSAHQMVDLVDTLLVQHLAGRRVTAVILKTAPNSRKDGDDRHQLVAAMQAFITMYRPHAAREDTDLFPKLKDVVSANEYDAMAEQFEDEEHKLFGEDGFEMMVQRVAGLEKAIGIADLGQFTPRG